MMPFENATMWEPWYLYGLSRNDPVSYRLEPAVLVEVLRPAGMAAFIGSTDLVNPLYIINAKGTSTWLHCFVVVYTNKERDALKAAADRRQSICVPFGSLHRNFNGHVQWPQDILQRYNTDFDGCAPFVISFLVFADALSRSPQSANLSLLDNEAIKAYGIGRFYEDYPWKLWDDIQAIPRKWSGE